MKLIIIFIIFNNQIYLFIIIIFNDNNSVAIFTYLIQQIQFYLILMSYECSFSDWDFSICNCMNINLFLFLVVGISIRRLLLFNIKTLPIKITLSVLFFSIGGPKIKIKQLLHFLLYPCDILCSCSDICIHLLCANII